MNNDGNVIRCSVVGLEAVVVGRSLLASVVLITPSRHHDIVETVG